jgi:hypothetical protein
MRAKLAIDPDDLCSDVRCEIKLAYQYVRHLGRSDKPIYDWLIDLFTLLPSPQANSRRSSVRFKGIDLVEVECQTDTTLAAVASKLNR